jgi:hypothetical protein
MSELKEFKTERPNANDLATERVMWTYVYVFIFLASLYGISLLFEKVFE